MSHPEAPKLNTLDNPKHHRQPQGIDDDRIPMAWWKLSHENTGSIQDAFFWTYESPSLQGKNLQRPPGNLARALTKLLRN